MKRIFTQFAMMAVVCAGVLVSTQVVTAQETRSQKIYIVNIPKILKEYNRAGNLGLQVTKVRESYVVKMNPLREKLAEKNAEFQKTVDPEKKKLMQQEAVQIQRELEDLERRAQAELAENSDKVIVQIYLEVKGAITDIAKANGIDMIIGYPASSNPADENRPEIARLMLQTPAMIPFYHDRMDLTDMVITFLNKKYPEAKPELPKVSTPTPGASGGK
ncbi:MAG: OmpH family outer membrane protein [Zavarzinella sp.]